MGVPISNVTRRVVYEASGTGPYNFTFEILAAADVAVYKDDALLTLTTDYTVTINTNGTGYITLVASPTGADQIAIVGNRTIQRTTDFVTGGDFFANTVNDELDQQTIFAQQNAEGLQRALSAPQTDPTTIDMVLPRASVRANKTLAFDADGNPTTGEQIGDYRGNWASGTAYNKRDLIKDTSNSNVYICTVAHTSSGSQPISTNTDAAKWDLIVDAVTAAEAQAAAEAAQAAAETAETNAETAETNAETAATAAASSASAASTSASNAATSATNASNSATAASGSASTASTAATNAGNSATAAASSATSASSSATSAANSATSASTSASSASTSASNAASYASAASTSASAASTSATNAANSATAAASSATSSASSATASAASASAAATSETNAAASAAEAATFDPDLFLSKSGNLSGLADDSTARTNLGVAIGTDVQAYNAQLSTLAGASADRATYLASNEGFGFRNRIINGDMRIDQRNAGAAVSGTGVYAVDRFVTDCVNAVLQSQQSSDVPSGQGFVNSLKVTVTTASSNASNDFAAVSQKIEANNVADFMLGTASAATITLSFWVKSSVTGTYVASFQNGLASRRSYPATYTINSANTWEKKTVTLVGDTSGTWETGNGQGIWIRFDLGSGSNFLGTANTWQGANAMRVSGAAKLSDTLNATFYLTGVQLEAGSVATPFERRLYGTELALCQRYFCTMTPAISSYTDGNTVINSLTFPVTMRASPTVVTGTQDAQSKIAGISYGNFSGSGINIELSSTAGTGFIRTRGITNTTFSAEL